MTASPLLFRAQHGGGVRGVGVRVVMFEVM